MLGARIVQLRQAAGLSREALARQLGITAGALGGYEQGRRTPDAGMLATLAQALDVSVDYLLTGTPATQRDLTAAARSSMEAYVPENPREAMILRILLELLRP